MLAHHESAPTLLLHATQRGQRHAVWGGTTLSRPITVTPAPKGASHTPTSPHQSVSTQASKPGQRGGGTTLSHHPKQARQHQESANTPSEHTPNANTKPPASKHAHSKPKLPPPARTQERPRQNAWAKQCERGNPWQQRATGMKQSRRNPQRRTRRTSTQGARKQRGLRRPCRPAPAQQG